MSEILFKLVWIYTESRALGLQLLNLKLVNVIFSTYTLHGQEEQHLAVLVVPTCTPFLALAAVSAWQAYIK